MKLDFDAHLVQPFIPFVFIHSNGSHWYGEALGELSELFYMLATHALDIVFEKYDNFVCANPHLAKEDWETGHLVFVDDKPFYPHAPDTVRFHGNFLMYSHVFNIDTNDPVLIERLTKAIRQNQQRLDYLMQMI